jgi:predicted glycogen debranching enzyme
MKSLDLSALGLLGMLDREWLVSNGIGGYASSTLCGLNTRKYHGLLVAALTPPVRRMVILSRIDETVYHDGQLLPLTSNEYPGVIAPQGYRLLRAFNCDAFPRWAYQADGVTIEKGLRLIKGQNTVCIEYTVLGGSKPIELEIRPMLALRGIHELMYQWNGRLAAEIRSPQQVQIPATAQTPEVFFAHDGEFTREPVWYLNTIYRREQERGYGGLEDVFNPGSISWRLTPGQPARFVCSTEPVELDRVIAQLNQQPTRAAPAPPSQVNNLAAAAAATVAEPFARELIELTTAADDFVVHAPASATPVAVMTHYPWSAPSGRGALISLPGLFLVPGRFSEARTLLESYVPLLDAGLMPSLFPENGGKPVYQGADVALWYINAAYHYILYTDDQPTGRRLLETLQQIIRHYSQGTKLGIATDADGLIKSSVPGLPTSWMDAQVVDWVVTPRPGRPVELNALWFNALRIVAELTARWGKPGAADEYRALAARVHVAFNRRFWNADRKCCYDVLEDHGPDAAIRPNQLFASSLPFPVLSLDRHAAALATITAELLTPFGIRTLSPRDPAYQGRYAGNVIARDRAYQQGSAYPWLLGPMVTATLRSQGANETNVARCRAMLEPCLKWLNTDGIGHLPELFDGDAPHHPGGALASAPAVAEILRCLSEDILGKLPHLPRGGGMSTGSIPLPRPVAIAPGT